MSLNEEFVNEFSIDEEMSFNPSLYEKLIVEEKFFKTSFEEKMKRYVSNLLEMTNRYRKWFRRDIRIIELECILGIGPVASFYVHVNQEIMEMIEKLKYSFKAMTSNFLHDHVVAEVKSFHKSILM